MKRKTLILVLLLLIVLTSAALAAKVQATGNVNVRTGPGLDYAVIDTVYEGNSLEYTGKTEYDDRGVAWYSVDCYGQAGWMSERYSMLEDGISTSGNGSDPSNADDMIDLSTYIGADFNTAGKQLNLFHMTYDEGEFSYTYSNDYILLGSYDGHTINSIQIYEDGPYSLYGMRIWQPRFEAEEILSKNGYSVSEADYEYGDYENHGNHSAVYVYYESNRLQTITSIEYRDQY